MSCQWFLPPRRAPANNIIHLTCSPLICPSPVEKKKKKTHIFPSELSRSSLPHLRRILMHLKGRKHVPAVYKSQLAATVLYSIPKAATKPVESEAAGSGVGELSIQT